MLLMVDLLKVIRLATLDEISHLLKLLDINYEKQLNIEQHLSLLSSLKLVIKKPYRHNVYYISSPGEHWLSWAFKRTAKICDLDRWKVMFTEYYSKNQKQKARALESYMKSEGFIGD